MQKFNGLNVGDAVFCNGYEGTVSRLCEWSDSMIEVKLGSGVMCVDAGDVKKLESDKHVVEVFSVYDVTGSVDGVNYYEAIYITDLVASEHSAINQFKAKHLDVTNVFAVFDGKSYLYSDGSLEFIRNNHNGYTDMRMNEAENHGMADICN